MERGHTFDKLFDFEAFLQRLLKHFPLLLNDVYLSEEYYGENVLHMAAVAEDPSIVKASLLKSSSLTKQIPNISVAS